MSQRPEKLLLQHYRARYAKAKRAKKKEILNEFCESHGYHRKAAVRLLNAVEKDRYGKRFGPQPRYEPNTLLPAIKAIWQASDYMCSKKLKSALALWLPHYESSYEALSAVSKHNLLTISASTLDRLLKPLRGGYKKRLCGTRPGSLLKTQIPIRTHHWDVSQPGFVEADTVAHCGNSMAGDFVWSLTLTDIFSGWTEIRATWNKGAHGIVEQINDIEKKLPFSLLGFDCDNGAEFLNYHLLNHFTQRSNVIQFTRSRPYHSDDNAHVEQKNWTHVRQLFGYDRFDNSRLVSVMNDLYATEWSLLQNYFCPNMKLVEKTKINSKYKKRYDYPKTPYQRLLACDSLTQAQKEQLKTTFETLNPFQLKQSIERKLKIIFSYVKVTGNMRQRL